MHRMKVVLPEPDGPMTTTTSRRATVKETPLSTWRRPNFFWTSVASTTSGEAPAGRPPMVASRSCPTSAIIALR